MKTLFFLLALFCCFACAPKKPTDGPITLTREDVTITVDPQLGGRITSLTLHGREILKTSRDSLNLQWGSTVWTSPQSTWKWPPPATFDAEPFTWELLRDSVILLESARDPDSQLRMRKRISLGPDADVGLTYWLINEGVSTVRVAAWENTRLPYAGYLEFAADSIRFRQDSTPVVTRDSTHYIYLDDRHRGPEKVFADLAADSVTFYRDGLFLRKFAGITHLFHTAPEQAPLEIYFNPEAGFMEFELQGEYKLLEPGEHVSLRTRWKVGDYSSSRR
ncbi:MAG: hypothetical protein AAFN92_06720 [Bacteroidota bacterium]